MADLEAVEKITIEGGDEAKKVLADIGNTGAAAFSQIAEAAMHGDFTGLVEKIGGELAASFYKAGEAIMEFVHSESEAVAQMAHLAEAAGADIGAFEGLQSAFAASGISAQGFNRTMGRLAISIGSSWSSIQESSRGAALEQSATLLSIQSAVNGTSKAYQALQQAITDAASTAKHDLLDLESAQLSLQKAQLTQMKGVGVDTSQMEASLKLQENSLAVEKARQAVADARRKQEEDRAKEFQRITDAELAIEKARQAEAEARQKQYQSDLKNVDLIAGKINQVAAGTMKWADSNVLVEASAQKIREAIIKATSMDSTGGAPKAMEVFMKVSEVFKGMGDDADSMAQKMAIVQRLMGAGFRAGQASASQLIAVLNKGPAALQEMIEAGERFSKSGIGISDKETHALEAFEQAWARLGAIINQVAGHFAAVMASGLTPWLERMRESLENNDGVLHRIVNVLDFLLQTTIAVVNIVIKLVGIFADMAEKVPMVNAALKIMAFLWDQITKPMDEFSANWDRIKNAATASIDWIVNKVKGLIDLLKNDLVAALQAVKSFFGFGGGSSSGGRGGDSASEAAPGAWTGGLIRGPGGPTSDRAGLWALSDGEFVVKSAAVSHYGADLFHALNSIAIGGMAAGGMVGPRVAVATPAAAGPSSILNLSIDGKQFKGLRASPDTARDLKHYAVSRQAGQTGWSPSWRR